MSTAASLQGSLYGFDIGRCVVVDVEVYPGRWCLGYRAFDQDGKLQTRVIDGERQRLESFLTRCAAADRIIVGYNSAHFDLPVINSIRKGFDPYPIAQSLIQTGELPQALGRLPTFPCNHIDISARLRRGGRIQGLKTTAANLGLPRLEELPFDPHAILTDEQWEKVVAYNVVDVCNTWALLERFAPDLEALAALSEETGQDLRSTPTPRVVERVFLRAFKNRRGTDPILPDPPQDFVYRPPFGVVRPRTKGARAWYDSVARKRISAIVTPDSRDFPVPYASFRIGRLMVRTGKGGLHSIDKPRVYYSTKKRRIVSVDVGSYYPSLIVKKGYAPAAYGEIGANTYRSIMERRLAVKEAAKKATDPEEKRRLSIQADGLKLVINSYFGKTGDRFSTLYDPSVMLGVTITGQLMLIDLIERLTKIGVRVISANTDGLFLSVDRADRRWREVLKQWQADTEMSLEIEPLRRLVILATNRYATLGRDGSIKRKGDGLKGKFSPVEVPNSLVVADAVANALLKDIPPERTVWECKELVRFTRLTRRSGKVREAVLLNESTREERPLPKLTRWYKARESSWRIVHRFEGERRTTPTHATSIALALDLTPDLPSDLDRSWYIAQARGVIQSVPGYRHLNRKLVAKDAGASALLDRGLVPVPKKGKAQPAGSDATKPTLLWEWHRFPTLGAYTGPKTATLVLDIDDPVKFKKAVDLGNSPLFVNRWDQISGCMVSVRGDANPEDVRNGKARGKLVFRLEAGPDHPLAKIKQDHWLKSKGVEIFYGKGMPSLWGAGPDNSNYRMEGTLGPCPDWALEILTPKRRGGAGGSKAEAEPERTERVEVDAETLEGLPLLLAELDPTLGEPKVGWRTKEYRDSDGESHTIWVGRCPFEHDSGRSEAGDLSAGYNAGGVPYVACKHGSCTTVPEIDGRLKAQHSPGPWTMTAEGTTEPIPEPEPLTLTPIAEAMLADLDSRSVSLQIAPTGSGKSYALGLVVAERYRRGLRTVVTTPTIRLANEMVDLLRTFTPHAFYHNAVAQIFGQKRPDSELLGDEVADEDAEPENAEAEYPITEETMIVVCSHAQLGRRGFSKFIRGLWEKLSPDPEAEEPGKPYAIVIDEVTELLREARREIPLAHRATYRRDPDGSGGRIQPIRDCPKSNLSGNCANCVLVPRGGSPKFNAFGIRELSHPPVIEIDSEERELRTPRLPLVVDLDEHLTLGPKIRVGNTTFAAAVNAYRGKPIDEDTRRSAPLYLFRREKGSDAQPFETPEEILSHMMDFAAQPVVIWEHPIDASVPDGNMISSEVLAARAREAKEKKAKGKRWDQDIIFPFPTCEVPRLRFTDTAGLEKIRRYAAENGVGVILAGAVPGPDDESTLRRVWPELVTRQHPYANTKIKQVGIAFVEDHRGWLSMVGDDGRLLTARLEEQGLGLVFCPTRKLAQALYGRIAPQQLTARLAVENYEDMLCRGSIHHKDDLPDVGTFVTYSRGVLGLGVNLHGIRHLVVDANAFRSVAGFNPAKITPEEFARLRAEERLALILQNIGRALRGEVGKTVAMIVLNADNELVEAIQQSGAIREGAELPTVSTSGDDIHALVDQADRWLRAGGGDWPKGNLGKEAPKKGRKKSRTKEDVVVAAEEAIAEGMKWRDFAQKSNARRYLTSDEIDQLKARFRV